MSKVTLKRRLSIHSAGDNATRSLILRINKCHSTVDSTLCMNAGSDDQGTEDMKAILSEFTSCPRIKFSTVVTQYRHKIPNEHNHRFNRIRYTCIL